MVSLTLFQRVCRLGSPTVIPPYPRTSLIPADVSSRSHRGLESGAAAENPFDLQGTQALPPAPRALVLLESDAVQEKCSGPLASHIKPRQTVPLP